MEGDEGKKWSKSRLGENIESESSLECMMEMCLKHIWIILYLL